MNRILTHARNNLVGYVALFVAMGGTGYAAVSLPAHSVGTRQLRRGAVGTNQLKNHSVTPIKLARNSIAGYVRDYAQVNGQGLLVASRPGAHVAYWRPDGPAPGGQVVFDQPIPASCFALAAAESAPSATYVTAQVSGGPGHGGAVSVNIAPSRSTGNTVPPQVNVAVICPEP